MSTRILAAGLLLSLSWTVNAATTIHFDDVSSTQVFEVESSGYLFSGGASWLQVIREPSGGGGNMLSYCPQGCDMVMSAVNGESFNLYSFDMAAAAGIVGPVTITGYYSAGGSIASTISVDSTVDSYALGTGWENLGSVVFGAHYEPSFGVAVDNVVVSTVPIPASVWLLGSALAGLGWLRRKQAA